MQGKSLVRLAAIFSVCALFPNFHHSASHPLSFHHLDHPHSTQQQYSCHHLTITHAPLHDSSNSVHSALFNTTLRMSGYGSGGYGGGGGGGGGYGGSRGGGGGGYSNGYSNGYVLPYTRGHGPGDLCFYVGSSGTSRQLFITQVHTHGSIRCAY